MLLSVLIIVFLSALMMTGCWDYQGLGEQTVVAGIAVDAGDEGEGYKLTFEIVDLNGAQDGQFGSILLTTTGETLAEAVYDAYARLHGHVYLGVTDVVIVGRQVAEQVGIRPLVDYLMRDRDARNSLRIAIAGTDTAAELFRPVAEEGDEGGTQDEEPRLLLSKALGESLSPRRQGARRATNALAVYEIHHVLHHGTSDVALPIVGASDTEDIPFQLDGLALFTDDRMTGALPEADMPVYLLATAGVRDRVFPVEVDGQRAVLAARHSRVRTDFDLDGGVLRFGLDIRVTADAQQLPDGWGEMTQPQIRRLELMAEEAFSAQVEALAERLRAEGHDVFGLAETVRSREPGLWEQIAEDWRAWLAASELDARIEVRVREAGMRR